MPITVTRTASVYNLASDSDLRELFVEHASIGWMCSLIAHPDDSGTETVWAVRMQKPGIDTINATLADVVISDLVTVQSMSRTDYNAANPGAPIEGFGS